jgi:fibronectin-binding autotransporter adhesin
MMHPRRSGRSPWSFLLRSATKQQKPLVGRRPLVLEVLEERTLLNSAPVLSLPQTSFNVVKTSTLTIPLSATDKDKGETLTFSLVNAPTGAGIVNVVQIPTAMGSAATATLSWTPTEDQGPADYPFTVVVKDNGRPVQSTSQAILVNTRAAGLVDNSQVGIAQPGQSLLIVGTSHNQSTPTNPGNDTVSVSALTAPNTVLATVNGDAATFTVPANGQVFARLFDGNDSFTLNEGTGTTPVGPALSVDGGTGSNSVTVNGTAAADSFTSTGTTVGLAGAGTLTYGNVQTLTVNGLAGNDSFSMTLINPTTATNLDGGPDADTFTGTFAQGYNGSLTLANLETATMQATGDFSGSLAVNSPGNLQSLSVTGTVAAGSTITATNFTNVTLGTLAGTLLASGGSITGASITSVAATGLLKATESAAPGSGILSGASIGGVSGTVFAASIVNTTIGSVAKGAVVTAQGQGTTNNVSIGSLSGSFTAPEDSNAGSGSMSNTTIGMVTSTGVVSTGSISGMSVGSNAGSITAAGQGTTNNVSIGTLSGSFTAPEDSNAGSGAMSNTTINSITSTGTVSTGSISGMSVGSNAGSITAAGQGTTNNVSIGSLSGSFTAPEDSNAGSGAMSNTTINSITSTGTVSTGSISGMSVGSADSGSSITAAGQGTASNVTINNLAGSLSAKVDSTPGSGTLSIITIGTLATTGSVNAATATDLTIATAGGTVNVTNTLTTLTAGTILDTANLMAGHFNVVTAHHAAPVVNFIEPTVTRTFAVTPHNPGTFTPPDYGIYYDGTGSGNPRVVVQMTAGTPFDLGVTTSTAALAGTGIDLAGLYAAVNGPIGIRNVFIGGNLLTTVSAEALTYFALAANTPGGVQLPQDIVAVAAAGKLPAASIVAKSVPAIAAGSFAGVLADVAANTDALVPLAVNTGVSQANDTFQVFFSEAGHVAQFLLTGPGGSFDAKSMLFADRVSDNHPVTASDTLVPSGSSTSVRSVIFTGQGGSLTTSQPITTSISVNQGGSLGDLILGAPQGITANITADRILGNIDATNGGISGIIQATQGDIGSAFTNSGTITGVTYLHAGGGGLTGKILAKGNLVSQVTLQSGIDGVIAVGGDIGVIQTANGIAVPKPDGSLIRFGGIVVSTGGLNGQVIALGNAFGDISITGGLSGRIAVQGKEEFGLSTGKAFSRTGILGNVSIGGGISTTGAVVSSGLLGDDGGNNINQDANGTHLTISGTDKGLLAAGEDINFGPTGSLNQLGLFQNATGQNQTAIDWIFTNGGVQLDVLDPNQFNPFLQDLLALTVVNGKLTGTTA